MDHFRRILEDAGVRMVRTAIQAPDMNSFAERWVQSVKSECLNRMILSCQGHLRRCLREFVDHYHEQRPHQGLGNELITPRRSNRSWDGEAVADERLGGLLRSYRRAA